MFLIQKTAYLSLAEEITPEAFFHSGSKSFRKFCKEQEEKIEIKRWNSLKKNQPRITTFLNMDYKQQPRLMGMKNMGNFLSKELSKKLIVYIFHILSDIVY